MAEKHNAMNLKFPFVPVLWPWRTLSEPVPEKKDEVKFAYNSWIMRRRRIPSSAYVQLTMWVPICRAKTQLVVSEP